MRRFKQEYNLMPWYKRRPPLKNVRWVEIKPIKIKEDKDEIS